MLSDPSPWLKQNAAKIPVKPSQVIAITPTEKPKARFSLRVLGCRSLFILDDCCSATDVVEQSPGS